MANYNTLKAAIEAVIRTNGNEEITGAILQDSLIAMINALGLGYQYMGVATAATNPGTPDQKVFYIALAAGTYTNFGGATVRQGITILKWDTAWTANELFSFAGSYTFTGNINFANISISSFEEFYDELSETSLRNELDNLIPRVYSAHDRNIAIFDEYGNVIDGGKSIQDIFDEINKAAKPTGIYEKMVAGSARGILSPSAIEELFLFQRTANGAGGTGAAVFQSIKGNSIVWNQLVQNGNFANGTANWFASANASISVASGECTITSTGTLTGARQNLATAVVAGHKYIIRASVKGASGGEAVRIGVQSTGMTISETATTSYAVYSGVFTANNNGSVLEISTTGGSIVAKDVNLIDITLSTMSVTSVSDFTKFYNLPSYAPNPGAIKNNCATGMVTDGFNQWDEDTFVSSGSLWARHYISALSNTEYNFTAPTGTYPLISFFDADKVQIGAALSLTKVSTAGHAVFTTPAGCNYIRFNMSNSYGTTYKNDICINLSGSRNGQYEPHWSDTTALPITTATGKLNGEGESVVITPNGLAGVGTSFDEAIVEKGMWTKTKKRRARVDLGTLEWSAGNVAGLFLTQISGQKVVTTGIKPNDICSKYVVGATIASSADAADKTIYQGNSNNYIFFKDTAFSGYTPEQVAAALAGEELEYELATPQLYVLDTPVPVVARVDEDGTQTILPQGVDESGVPMTAPFKASTQYPVKLGVAPIGQQSLVNLLERMKSAGKIASYTMVWDATTGVYDFTIS